jgi:hypothetical protein
MAPLNTERDILEWPKMSRSNSLSTPSTFGTGHAGHFASHRESSESPCSTRRYRASGTNGTNGTFRKCPDLPLGADERDKRDTPLKRVSEMSRLSRGRKTAAMDVPLPRLVGTSRP